MAMEQINEKGGINGHKFSWSTIDTKSDQTEGAKAGLEAVRKGADLVVVTCDYDYGAPAALAAQNAGKISFFLCAEDAKAGIQGVGAYSFTASIAAPVQGATMAEWAIKKRNWKNAFVLLDDNYEYNKSVCAGFDWAYPKFGGQIVDRDAFKNDDPSIASQVTHIRNIASSIDFIMLCGSSPGGPTAMRQIRAAGIDLPIVSSMAMDGSYWIDAVPNLSNFYIPVQGSIYGNDLEHPVNEFVNQYSKRWGQTPPTSYVFPGWVMIEVYAEAVKRAGTSDPAAVVGELEKLQNFPTRFGPRTFTSQLHIQDASRYEIMGFDAGKPAPVGYWTVSEDVPLDVLFRK